MAVRSKQLVARLSGGTGAQSYYTVPAGETTLVKDLNLFALAAAPGAITLRLQLVSGLVVPLLRLELPQGESVQREVWWALHPGDQLQAFTTAADGYALLVSGAELEGVAD